MSNNTEKIKNRAGETFGLKDFFTFAIIVLAIVLPIRIFVAQPFIVNGASMSPTFESGQYLIVDQLSYRFDNPRRGDVIIFRFPEDKSKFFIKRVIGLPNETVDLSGNQIFITNDNETFEVDQSFIKNTKSENKTFELSDDQYFVMGDNRSSSFDSRSFGPLKEDFIVGRAWVRLLPISEIDILPGSYDY